MGEPTTAAHDWRAWFRGYAADGRREDPGPLARRYAASFLAAGPKGSGTYPNDDAFLDWLRAVHAGNVAAGLVSMDVAATREVPLGPAFVLVTVTWEATFRATGDHPVRFDVSYLLATGETPQVLAYVSHEDEDDAKRRAGITPSPAPGP